MCAQAHHRVQAVNKETGEKQPLIANSKVVLLSAQDCPWRYGEIEFTAAGAYENPDLIAPNNLLGMTFVDSPIDVQFKREGKTRNALFANHDLALLSRGDLGSWRVMAPHHTLLLSISNEVISTVSADGNLSDRNEFALQAPFTDSFIQAAMLAMSAEGRSGFAGGQLYGDSMVTAIAAHLLAIYGVQGRKLAEPKGRLAIATLREVTSFLQQHYAEDVSLAKLSSIAHLSPYHFSRLFKQSTGMTPHQYITNCRVEAARKLIVSSGMTVKQIAQTVGFSGPSHLAKQFKNVYGVSPSEVESHVIKN